MAVKELTTKDLIGKKFIPVLDDILDKKHMHYFFKGGRGSLKSSFVSIYIILAIMIDYSKGNIVNCVGLRKVYNTISDSVFANLVWAIDMLGVSSEWNISLSPLKLKYRECTILFRGCANKKDYERIKSIKFSKGYCKYAIFEELTEFKDMDEIRYITQSLFRGGDGAVCFYMYNPPPSKFNWVNEEARIKINNRYVHHSTYLDVNPEWLGVDFINEAENLKLVNERKYNSMYLGQEIGEGLEIYKNLTFRTISNDEIQRFDKIHRGLDFGYTHASCYSEVYFDQRNDTIYIIDEVYGSKLDNKTLATKIKEKAGTKVITGDSEDPRTINELNSLGLKVQGAKKGKDSKSHGIKWLQDLKEIVIDKKRTPNIAWDFESYELKEENGDYPDEPDGSASVRYALETIILKRRLIGG